MRITLVMLTFIILFFSMFSGCIFNSDDGGDDKDPGGFSKEELTIPEFGNLAYKFQVDEKPDSDQNTTKHSYKYETSWAFEYNQVYAPLGGVMQVWLTNLGETEMYIYEFGLAPQWSENNITKASDKLISPDEEVDLGYISFPGPDSGGEYEYQLKFGLMVRNNESTPWYDWGLSGNKTYMMSVKGQNDGSGFPDYEPKNNPGSVYETVNELIDPMQKDVRGTAVLLAKRFEGNYNIYQLCEMFEYVKLNISYVNDPKGNENYWACPDETLLLGAGDCEDQALLVASLITSISGTTRIYLTDTHAFAAVYIGDTGSIRDGVLAALDIYYGTELNYATFQDELGYWLVLDPISSMHAGGFPLGSEPLSPGSVSSHETGSSGGESYPWEFTETETLYIIDVK
jgi:hypothetical protein